MAWMVGITSPSFSSYCPCWTSGTGWLQLSFVLCFSSHFALSRSQSFGLLSLLLAVLFSCLQLAMLFCLLLALLFCLLLALLFSVLFLITPDLRCCSRAVLVPVLVYFVLLFSDPLTTGSLAVVPSVHLLQSHFVVVYDCVVRFWLFPTPLLNIAPLRD